MISAGAALTAPDSTVTITLVNVIADGELSPSGRLRDGRLTPFYVTSAPPVSSPMWAIRHEGEVMRELPDLRHPALAARGRHPVLAVYDGSAASKHALAYAAGLARRTDRWLVIVRIWRFGARQVERLRRLRAELADTDLGGLDIEIVARIGDPARELIRATAERRADALVIGASRRLTRAAMTVRVVRRAACPAVVVP
jgi:nucleotide-binding universal stress UspA family protein